MGKYDRIIAKQGDATFKILQTRIALANEKSEQNRLKRIELALATYNLDKTKINLIEAALEEDLDLSDQA